MRFRQSVVFAFCIAIVAGATGQEIVASAGAPQNKPVLRAPNGVLTSANAGASGTDATVSLSDFFGCYCHVVIPSINVFTDLVPSQQITIGGEVAYATGINEDGSLEVTSDLNGSPLHYSAPATNQAWSYPAVTNPILLNNSGYIKGRGMWLQSQDIDGGATVVLQGGALNNRVLQIYGHPWTGGDFGALTIWADSAGNGLSSKSSTGTSVYAQSQGDANTAPTIIAKLAPSQAATVPLFQAQDSAGAAVYTVRGNGTIVRTASVTDAVGAGAPSGACVTGSTYRRTDGGTATSFYVCESTAWVGK